jgi:glycosidase
MIDDWENGIPQFPEKPGDAFANNCFFGGSLYGIIEKLDYLSSLGVNTLYLNPIFDAASNHKYDTADYMKVDEMFGGEKALDALISALKKRGMHLILDGVFNHTGADSIYFNKFGNYNSIGAYQSTKSPYYDWFDFKKHPDDYNCWWGVKILPCLKKDSEGFRNYICGKDGVAAHYMKKGIDGFRLDVADELSNEFLYELRDTIKSIDTEAVLYGEVWEDASEKVAYGNRRKYFFGHQLDGVMNYPLRDAIINYVTTASSETLASVSSSLYYHYPKCVSDVQMNLLGTHDTERILNVLSGENTASLTNRQLSRYKLPKDSRERAIKLLKIAVFLNYTLPGVPCIYYGDEAGMEGGRDPFNRMPYPYGKEDTSLIDFYRALGNIRTESKDLRDGAFEILTAEGGLFVFTRNNTICACNRGEARNIVSDKPFKDIISGKTADANKSGQHIYTLETDAIAIFKK